MPPTVYLHVGAPKTGTSFLQDVLWNNRDALARAGVSLPGTRRGQFQATVEVRELSLQGRWPSVVGAWQRLADEARARAGTAVISHELFAAASQQQARQAVASLQPADVHLVYTARDLGRQIPAEWQQHVKHRGTVPWGEYVQQVATGGPRGRWFWRVQNPAGVLARWGAALPPERVHLVTVPPPGSDPSLLWRRFATVIGLDPDACDTSAARGNPSLGAVEAELLRRVNLTLGDRVPLPGPHNRFVKDTLGNDILAQVADKEPFGLPPERRAWLTEQSQRVIDELGKLGCDVVGDLDELQPGTPAGSGDPDRVDDAAAAEAALGALADVLDRLRGQARRTQAARQRAQAQQQTARDLRHTLSTRKRGDAETRQQRQQAEHTAAALRADLQARQARPVKHALIDLSEQHQALMAARRGYWRIVNTARAWRR